MRVTVAMVALCVTRKPRVRAASWYIAPRGVSPLPTTSANNAAREATWAGSTAPAVFSVRWLRASASCISHISCISLSWVSANSAAAARVRRATAAPVPVLAPCADCRRSVASPAVLRLGRQCFTRSTTSRLPWHTAVPTIHGAQYRLGPSRSATWSFNHTAPCWGCLWLSGHALRHASSSCTSVRLSTMMAIFNMSITAQNMSWAAPKWSKMYANPATRLVRAISRA